jgi:hypothetical protein
MGGTPVYNLCLVFVADYPTFLMWNQYYEHVFSPWGPNTPYGEYVRGSEGIGPGQLWVVETNLWYAARWIVSPGGGLGYNGAYAGTGVQSDADDSFYNPQDMTRDVNNRLFILDKLSDNTPRIKVFESTGEPAASLGGFGNTMTINSTPLRIEGSDFVDPAYGNLLFVLHGDSPPYKLSIFFPNEMP